MAEGRGTYQREEIRLAELVPSSNGAVILSSPSAPSDLRDLPGRRKYKSNNSKALHAVSCR